MRLFDKAFTSETGSFSCGERRGRRKIGFMGKGNDIAILEEKKKIGLVVRSLTFRRGRGKSKFWDEGKGNKTVGK